MQSCLSIDEVERPPAMAVSAPRSLAMEDRRAVNFRLLQIRENDIGHDAEIPSGVRFGPEAEIQRFGSIGSHGNIVVDIILCYGG